MANMPVFQGIILQRCIAKLLKTCKMTFFNRWGVENLQHAKLSWRRPRMSMHVWWAPASYKWSYNPTYNWARAHLTGETLFHTWKDITNISAFGFSNFLKQPWSKSKSFTFCCSDPKELLPRKWPAGTWKSLTWKSLSWKGKNNIIHISFFLASKWSFSAGV